MSGKAYAYCRQLTVRWDTLGLFPTNLPSGWSWIPELIGTPTRLDVETMIAMPAYGVSIAFEIPVGQFPLSFHPDLGSVLSGGTGRGYSSRSRGKSIRLDFA